LSLAWSISSPTEGIEAVSEVLESCEPEEEDSPLALAGPGPNEKRAVCTVELERGKAADVELERGKAADVELERGKAADVERERLDMALASPRLPQEDVRWRSQELVRLSSASAAAASALKPLVMPEDIWESSACEDQVRLGRVSAHLCVVVCDEVRARATAHRVLHRFWPRIVVPADGPLGVALEVRRCAHGATDKRHRLPALPTFDRAPGNVVGDLPLLQRDRGQLATLSPVLQPRHAHVPALRLPTLLASVLALVARLSQAPPLVDPLPPVAHR